MKFLFILSISIFMFSCEKEAPSSALSGSWQWVKSSGGFAGITIKASENQSKKLVFGSNNSYSYFENNKLIINTTYSIEKGKSITNTNLVDLLILKDMDGFTSSFTIENNRLYLFDEVYDGFQHEYIKI